MMMNEDDYEESSNKGLMRHTVLVSCSRNSGSMFLRIRVWSFLLFTRSQTRRTIGTPNLIKIQINKMWLKMKICQNLSLKIA